MTERQEWTDQDHDAFGWHDNHVHGLRIRSEEHGTGELELDLDHILEWLPQLGGSFRFRIARAALTFHEVSDLRIVIDFKSAQAAIGPFSIHSIVRVTRGSGELGHPGYYSSWRIDVNWPAGEITFDAAGYTMSLRGSPIVSDSQWIVGRRP